MSQISGYTYIAIDGVGSCIDVLKDIEKGKTHKCFAGCLTHGEKNKAEVDKYGREALEKTITDAVSIL